VVARTAEAILEGKRLQAELDGQDALLQQLFGDHWRDLTTDWLYVTAVSDWLIVAHNDVTNGHSPASLITYTAHPLMSFISQSGCVSFA